MATLIRDAESSMAEAADSWPLCCYRTEFSPLPLVATSGPRHLIRYVNPAFCRLVGKERANIVGLPFAVVVPEELGNSYLAFLDQVYQTGQTESVSDQCHSELATAPHYWSYVMWAVTNEEREAGVMIQVTDTTAAAVRHLQLTKISEALLLSNVRQHQMVESEEADKGVLRLEIGETEHRAKNSLQTIASLINLQLGKDAEAVSAFELTKIQIHIKTIAAMHDVLAHTLQGHLPAKPFTLNTLLKKLMPLWIRAAGTAQIEWQADELELAVKKVMPVATVINELLCNAIKHGGRVITLQISKSAAAATIQVRDDGAGFPGGFTIDSSSGFGLKFVQSVGRQELGGEVACLNRPKGGASVTLTFPL